MAWRFTDALDEVDAGYGPNLLTGDYQAQNPGWALDGNTWSGEGSLHLHEGDPLQGPIITSDTTHVVTADVMAFSEVTVTWAVHLGASDGDVTLGPWSETIPAGAWVTVWQEYRTPPGTLGGSPTLTVTGPVQVRAPRASLIMDQTVVRQVVAGDPDGARVVLAGDALTAYDQTGTETARIAGEGGEFVGGEFRTSDTLPGRVTLADDAYINSTTGGAHPGIRVEPLDTSDMARPPGIGPGDRGLYVDGGSDTSGRRSYLRASPTSSLMRTFREGGTDGGVIQTSPTSSLMRTYREDGTIGASIQADPDSSRMRTYSGNSSEQGWVRAQPQDAELAYVAPNNVYFSRIRATDKEAHLFTRAGGSNRYLTIDANGIWVKTDKGGSLKQYNLEETAQDSGWHPIQVLPGYTAQPNYAPKARKVGNLIYLSGGINGSGIGANTAQDVMRLPASFRPVGQSIYVVGGSSYARACPLMVIQPDGVIALRTAPDTGNYYLMDGLSFIPE